MPENSPTRILVADDDADVLHALRLLLRGDDYQVETATSPAGVIQRVESEDFDAALLDLNYARDTTSGHEGIELVARLRALDSLAVIVMTAWSAWKARWRRCAAAPVTTSKPWNNARLLATLQSQPGLSRALRCGRRLELENRILRRDVPRMIAESPAMRPVLELIARVGPSEANVLVTGEHGTGKELVARILHASSPRAARAMVTVNVGGLSEGVFESEVFGHERGALTGARTERAGRFELADGGSLFLDEIANVPLAQQACRCACSRRASSSAWDRRARAAPPCGWSRPPTRIFDPEVAPALPRGFALPHQHGRDPPAGTARPARGTFRSRRPTSPASRATVPPVHGFEPDAMAALLAHPWPGNARARPRGGARGAAGGGRP